MAEAGQAEQARPFLLGGLAHLLGELLLPLLLGAELDLGLVIAVEDLDPQLGKPRVDPVHRVDVEVLGELLVDVVVQQVVLLPHELLQGDDDATRLGLAHAS